MFKKECCKQCRYNKSEPFEQFGYGTTQRPSLLSLVKFPLAVQDK